MKANRSNHYLCNRSLREKANYLRKNMTKGEACMWKYVLRAGLYHGFKFRRQRPILFYIADFVCFELMLIIEIDGFTHDCLKQQAKDSKRDKILSKVGFHTLRFSDWEVINKIHNVIDMMDEWCRVNRKSNYLK